MSAGNRPFPHSALVSKHAQGNEVEAPWIDNFIKNAVFFSPKP